MKKYWMLIGLTAMLMTACGPKEPPMSATPPQAQPAAAAPDTTQQAAQPADTAQAAAPAAQPVKVKKAVSRTGMPAGPYTIQVAAWETRESAEKLAAFYSRNGFEARVENADLNNGRWYRVRVGNYPSYAEAETAAAEIREKYKSDVWLVKL
ncbi:SPOR domain-containing protein [bacterium]|nr:SPOR domain-containing protein [bacterium]